MIMPFDWIILLISLGTKLLLIVDLNVYAMEALRKSFPMVIQKMYSLFSLLSFSGYKVSCSDNQSFGVKFCTG